MPVLIADAQERTALHTGWPIVAGFVLVIALGHVDHDGCSAFDLNWCDLQRQWWNHLTGQVSKLADHGLRSFDASQAKTLAFIYSK